jgi:hypothetical protein
MPRKNRNKFKKERKNKNKKVEIKSDNTDYSIEIDKEVIYVPQEIEKKVEKKSKFLFFEKAKDKKADDLIEKLEELTNDMKKKSEEQKNKIVEDTDYLEKKAQADALKHSNEVKDLVIEKIKENAIELKDLILFRKKIDIKDNLKEDMDHIKETIIEKIKDYIEDMSEEIIEKINENVSEIKEIIFGKDLKQEETSKKSNTFDSLIQNLKSFSTKFEKKEDIIEEKQKVKMFEIVEKEEKVKKELKLNNNLKVIEEEEELILSWPIAQNRCKKDLNITFTNIDNSDEIIVQLLVNKKFGSVRSHYYFSGEKSKLVVEKKWTNTLKIKIMNNTLYLTNDKSTIKKNLKDKKIDIIKTNINLAQWL